MLRSSPFRPWPSLIGSRLIVFLCLLFLASAQTLYAQAAQPTPVQTPAQQDSQSDGQQDGQPDRESEDLWYGVIETPMAHLRTVIVVNNGEEPAGWVISPDQTDKRFPLEKLEIDEQQFAFESSQLGAKYSGRKDGQSYTGEFQQRGGKFTLKLSPANSMPPMTPRKTWAGTLEAGPRKLKIQFRLFDSPDGSDFVVMDSLNEGIKGLHATYAQTDQQLTLKIPGLKAEFVGALSSDKQKAEGVWKQGGAELPFVLEALAAESSKPTRPQTPKPPFPYDAIEVKFDSDEAGVTLAGTLTIPKQANQQQGLQVAVLVSGSGPQDRDETILEHKPFAVLADHLGRQGIAVLRYDDRGVGNSTGDFGNATTRDLAKDALGAVRFLKEYSDADFESIGIIGHSEGGMIGPIVAAEQPDEIDFVVMLAGPGVPGREIIESQTQLLLAAAGADETTLKQSALVSQAMLEVLKNSADDLTYESLVQQVAQRLFEQLPDDARAEIFDPSKGDSPEEQMVDTIKTSLRTAVSPWYRYFVNYDPLPTLKKVTCPVLALNGERDLQVDPKLNLPVIRAALKHSKSEARELPQLNHMFQRCETGAVDEYYSIEETINQSVLDLVSKWILSIRTASD